jgi:hypothetical protein
MPEARSTVIPALRYANAPAAIDWLCQVLGFERHQVYPGENGTIAHAELTLGGGMIMLGSAKNDEYGSGFTSPSEVGGPCPRRCRRRNHCSPAPEHPLWQPRIQPERPRRPLLERGHLRPLGRARVSWRI